MMIEQSQRPGSKRREVLIQLLMWGTLAASYGTAVLFAARFIYPRPGMRRRRTVFLAPASDIPPGESKTYTLPDGTQALVTHTGAGVVALSNICPHLGCRVHWEARNQRFFCPCHGGVFNSDGMATEGPPAAEGKNLKKYSIRPIGGNLFLETEEIVHL